MPPTKSRPLLRPSIPGWIVWPALAALACSSTDLEVLGPRVTCEEAAARGVRARPSDTWVDAVGVTTFFHYTDTTYGDDALMRDLLRDLGVRHVRDPGTTARATERLGALSDLGIEVLLLLAPDEVVTPQGGCPAPMTCRDAAGFVRAYPGVLEGIQLADAIDATGPTWTTSYRDQAKALHEALRADEATAAVRVVGGILEHPEQGSELGDLSAWLDAAAFTPVARGVSPEPTLAQIARETAALAPSRELHDSGIWYKTNADADADAVDEPTQAIYLVRAVLDGLDRGVRRTYLHDLIDTHWFSGLFRSDGTPKPSATAIATLLEYFADDGPAFETDRLAFTLNGAPDDLRTLLFQSRDRTFHLVLWRARDTAKTPATAAIDLVLPMAPATLARLDPFAERPTPEALEPDGASVRLVVSEAPQVISMRLSCPG